MKYFKGEGVKIVIDRNYDKSFGVGIELYTHKHMIKTPRHAHLLIVLGFWFFEFQIGKDTPKGGKRNDAR